MLFVKAYLDDGTQVISEFTKLKGIRELSAQVYAGSKAFPVWKIVSDVHPESGEPVLSRTRQFLSGRIIDRLEVVEPTQENHGYSPDNFGPVISVSEGAAGRMVFTEEMDVPDGVAVNIEYPLHVAPDGRRFVIVTSNSAAGDEDVLHYIDAEGGDTSEIDPEVMVPGAPEVGDPDESYDDEDQVN